MLVACAQADTADVYSDADTTWHLVEIDGESFEAPATLTFPENSRVSGEGPCNLYGASLIAPYPKFEISPVMATQRACPFLAEEQQYFDALSLMTDAEVLDDTLSLSSPAGRKMVFKAGA